MPHIHPSVTTALSPRWSGYCATNTAKGKAPTSTQWCRATIAGLGETPFGALSQSRPHAHEHEQYEHGAETDDTQRRPDAHELVKGREVAPIGEINVVATGRDTSPSARADRP